MFLGGVMSGVEQHTSVAVVGLGYVGLPLAVEFGKVFPTLGFDIEPNRIRQLREGVDRTGEVEQAELRQASRLRFSLDPGDLVSANVYVITVPTPIDQHKRPDLRPLEAASRSVGKALRRGDTVIYESTVYPGATEEYCVPLLAAESGLEPDVDFSFGYSPERINPGDKTHRLTSIKKVTSGSTAVSAEFIDDLYSRIIAAGTYRAPSVRVAEAAKVIENTQRDVNIALINEFALLFNKLGIDTLEVLEAAGTKWNFLPFRPGLVGGHCIGVDPYYLTHKAQEVGHHPEVILSGRRINDSMGTYVADQVVLELARKGLPVGGARILVCGLAFKENCPDMRNTRVIDILKRLAEYSIDTAVVDPWVDPLEAERDFGIRLLQLEDLGDDSYEAAIVATGHSQFRKAGGALRKIVGSRGLIYDVKGTLGDFADKRL